jgi:hypothetical protein
MEYLLGYAVAMLSFIIGMSYMKKYQVSNRSKVPIFSQSRKYFVSRAYEYQTDTIIFNYLRNSQSSKYLRSKETVIVIVDDEAYWIQDNQFYQAPVIKNNVDHENKKIVDTINMDDVQLRKISTIVDRLTEENNHDSGNTGYPKFF